MTLTSRTVGGLPAAVVDELLGRLGDRLHLDADLAALCAGYRTRRLPWGGREYHDPRFDRLGPPPTAALGSIVDVPR